MVMPWEMIPSLSISPNLSPPALLRPWVGCRVIATTGPLARAQTLSSTICLKRWQQMGPMNTKFSKELPEKGLNICSFPYFWYPLLCSSSAFSSRLKLRKGVESSLKLPKIAATFAVMHSRRWPIVILEGMQWGLTIMSGMMPSRVKGRSSCRNVMPQVPFCPCLEANLSPIWGILTLLTFTLMILFQLPLRVTTTASTVPFSPLLERREMSLYFGYSIRIFSPEPTSILPTKTSSPSTTLPGEITPSWSIFLNFYSMIFASLGLGLQILDFDVLRLDYTSSVLQVRQKALRNRPRSIDDWLIMMLSYWLQPVKQAIATMGFMPIGIWFTDMYRVGIVLTNGRWGQQSSWFKVYILIWVFIPLIPIACLDIALWSVFLVA